MAHVVDRGARSAQVDAGVGARGRGGRRLRRRGPLPRPVARRRVRRGDLPHVRAAGLLRVRRRRVPAAVVPGVQQLGDRGVRRPPVVAGGDGVDARHRRRHRRRQGRRRPGVPCAVPARAGAVADVQRRCVRPVLGRRPGPRAAVDVPLRYRPRTASGARARRCRHQLPHGRAARRTDGHPHPRRRRCARPVPRAARSSRSRPGRRGWRGS